MRKFSFRACASLVLAAAFCTSSFAQTTVVAVNFGGDLVGSAANSTLDNSGQVFMDTGDFNNDTITDARWGIPIDHAGNFVNIGSPITPGLSNTWAAGAEIINYGSTTSTGVNLFRVANSGAADPLQMTNVAGTRSSIGLVFAPHVRKANFLNGASSGTSVSFTNTTNGFFFDYFWQSGTTNFAPNLRENRATVQNGSD